MSSVSWRTDGGDDLLGPEDVLDRWPLLFVGALLVLVLWELGATILTLGRRHG